MSETKSEHADLLNTLVRMQESPHYALRRETLQQAEQTIWRQSNELAGLRVELTRMTDAAKYWADKCDTDAEAANRQVADLQVISRNERARAEAAEGQRDACLLEAQSHAQEARAANATIAEIYQAFTASTGEPGNWNGAEPARKIMAKLAAAERDAARYAQAADAEMERVKACEHIANGDTGWERLRELCPSTSAVANMRDRYQWAANELLACDYGDNETLHDIKGGVVGWIVYGWRHARHAYDGLSHKDMPRIYGQSIDTAIDAAARREGK